MTIVIFYRIERIAERGGACPKPLELSYVKATNTQLITASNAHASDHSSAHTVHESFVKINLGMFVCCTN